MLTVDTLKQNDPKNVFKMSKSPLGPLYAYLIKCVPIIGIVKGTNQNNMNNI